MHQRGFQVFSLIFKASLSQDFREQLFGGIHFSFLALAPHLTSELGPSSNNFLWALPSSWEHLAAHPPHSAHLQSEP